MYGNMHWLAFHKNTKMHKKLIEREKLILLLKSRLILINAIAVELNYIHGNQSCFYSLLWNCDSIPQS